MKNIPFILLSILCLSSCEPQDYYYKDLIKGKTIILPGKPHILHAKSGLNRLEFLLKIPHDPLAEKLLFLWNNRQDSVFIPITEQTKGTEQKIQIQDISEDNHSFTLVSIAASGIKSVPSVTNLMVYGPNYSRSLANRILRNVHYDGNTDHIYIKWEAESNSKFVSTKIMYKNRSGNKKEIILPEDINEFTLSDFSKLEQIHYSAGYKPDPNLLDTLYSPSKEIKF